MKKILFQLAVLIPAMVFGQGVNIARYDGNGILKTTYIGSDNGNYRFTKYYDNGIKAETGRYKNGEKHGTWKSWDYQGRLTSVAHYNEGEKSGKWLIVNDTEHTTFEISFNHNHLIHALKKDDNGHVMAKR